MNCDCDPDGANSIDVSQCSKFTNANDMIELHIRPAITDWIVTSTHRIFTGGKSQSTQIEQTQDDVVSGRWDRRGGKSVMMRPPCGARALVSGGLHCEE